jgi:hypothetical protein
MEWVDKRKKKMIVLQELNNIDHSLEVVTAEGTVDNEKWKSGKVGSTVTMFLPQRGMSSSP